MDAFVNVLDEMTRQVSVAQHRNPELELSAFLPVKGNLAVGELMIVGRAPNGWGESWRPSDAVDSHSRKKIIDEAIRSSWARDRCPMSWISRWWSTLVFQCGDCKKEYTAKTQSCNECGGQKVRRAYNPARSPFWRVVREATHALAIADRAKVDWPSNLIWTDLYKISPYEGGNPSSSLIRLQQSLCVQLLCEEIRHFKPRRILFLTGHDWAQPFLAGMGVTYAQKHFGYVSFAEAIEVGSLRPQVVVAPHPQGKPEALIVHDITAAFKKLPGQ